MIQRAIVICLFAALSQCKRADVQPDPKIAALVGSWQLMSPDSAAGTTINFSLDTANPPHDITAFDVRGQGLQSSYSGRMYATIDGTMQLQQLVNTANQTSNLISLQTDRLYLTKLGSVARFEQSDNDNLRLYFGIPKAGSLLYRRNR